MTASELKHQAALARWKEKIADCRGRGMSVEKWCAEQRVSKTTYYRWERELFGKVQKPKDGTALSAPVPTFAELPAPGQVCRPFLAPAEIAARIRIENVEVDLYAGAEPGMVQALCKALKSC